MKEVIAKQKEHAEFAYLLDTASARLGRPVSHGDMETLLYLYETGGLPVEVILMVIEYAIAEGKYHMRYIEKVALDWADRGIDTIGAAEQFLCALEKRRDSWQKVSTVLGIKQSPTIAQSDAAERWIFDWKIDEGLLRLAYDKCKESTGRFNSSYMNKILEGWYLNGIDTVEKALEELEKIQSKSKAKAKSKSKKETSFDLDEYASMVDNFTPVYKK
jgi:DnaD/phage-associated family protein